MKSLCRAFCVLPMIACMLTLSAQVPILSSYPAGAGTIFLDFDGQTVDGTSWNYNGPIYCGAAGLTTTQMEEIFNRVAEDYRPFDLNVTTDSNKYLAAPLAQRTRVIITPTYSWWGAAGGVAWTGSFSWGDDTPCFVFSLLLGNSPKNISESASHEAGHTLGLSHQSTYDTDCNKISEYNLGKGAGEIGWAPIMGAGYYQNLTLWNIGPNNWGCANEQNDLDLITSPINGVHYRDDDHTNSFITSTLANFVNNRINIDGLIERGNDQDMFRFIMPGTGRFQLDAMPYHVGANNAGSNLDMQVSLYDASQTLVTILDPATVLGSVADTTLNAGTYFLKIEGKGNQYAPAYASLGSYSLEASVSNTANPLPIHRIELRGKKTGSTSLLSWIIDADEAIVSQALEVSIDGHNFSTLHQSSSEARFFNYQPSNNKSLFYRLNVTFSNGLRYYSNVASIRDEEFNERPKIVSNLINSNTIYASSPGDYRYSLIDFMGKTIQNGKLRIGLNTIETKHISAGMYFIVFTNDEHQWTDKLIRQ